MPLAVKQYWENPQTVSLRDENLRLLEQQMIARHLEPTESLLEMGCGDCINTLVYHQKARKTWAIDYSRQMLIKAKIRIGENHFDNLHLLNGDFSLVGALRRKFQTIISQRCLINLQGWEEQKEAISILSEKLKDHGILLMLETIREGLENLNQLRNKFGLPSIAQPWHNQNFNLNQLLHLLQKYFVIEEMRDFSFYFINTRVLGALLGLTPGTEQSIRMDAAVRMLAEKMDLMEIHGIGPQIFFKLRKKKA